MQRIKIILAEFVFIFLGEEPLCAQKVKGSFKLRILPDKAWFLQLEKNGFYRYFYSKGFNDKTLTLDSGFYNLKND